MSKYFGTASPRQVAGVAYTLAQHHRVYSAQSHMRQNMTEKGVSTPTMSAPLNMKGRVNLDQLKTFVNVNLKQVQRGHPSAGSQVFGMNVSEHIKMLQKNVGEQHRDAEGKWD